MTWKQIIFVLLFISSGCGGTEDTREIPDHIRNLDNLNIYSGDKEPVATIELVKELVLTQGDDVLIGSVSDMAVDRMGRVFISDNEQNVIHVYTSDGTYSTTLGGEGSGPGEFRTIGDLNIIGDELFAYDAGQLRFNIYSTESMELTRSLNLNRNLNEREELPSSRPGRLFVRNDDLILAQFTSPRYSNPESPNYNLEDELVSEFYLMDTNGSIVSDKIFEQKDEPILITSLEEFCCGTNFDFLGKPLLEISTDGHIYAAWSTSFLIKVFDPYGVYQYSFFYPSDPIELSREDAMRGETNNFRQRMIQVADLPAFWPPLNSLHLDDENRLWVSTVTENMETVEWWVLHDRGELISKFDWSNQHSIVAIVDGYVYTRETDDETGLTEIVRYRIEMEEV